MRQITLKIFTNKNNGQRICYLPKKKIGSKPSRFLKIKEYEFE